MTDEQYVEYLVGSYGMSYIAGYIESKMTYGTFTDEDEEKKDQTGRATVYRDDLPF
jgi:hypothetical protein